MIICRGRHRWASILLGLAVCAVILLVPLPVAQVTGGEPIVLSPTGRASLAIVALCQILWITEALPHAVTALGVFLLFPLAGVSSLAELVSSGLGNPVMLFFLSLLLLSAAFVHVGLSQRVTRLMLCVSKGKSEALILITLAAGALLAMTIGSLAATAVLLGAAQETLRRGGSGDRGGNLRRSLLISTSLGPAIGSLGTPAGAGSNPLALGYLEDLAGVRISFLNWTTLGAPAVLVLVPIAWLILRWTFPTERGAIFPGTEISKLRSESRSPLSRRERAFLLIFGATVLLWIIGPVIDRLANGHALLSMQGVSLAAALLLFLPGLDLVPWSVAEREVPWGTLLVLAGGLAAGFTLYRTGAARWLAWASLWQLGAVSPVLRVFLVVAAVSLLRFLFSSSTAAAAILVPLIIALGQDLGTDPWLMAAPAAFATNIAYTLPVQAAVHLIPYSLGHFSVGDMVRVGLPLTIAAVVVVGVSIIVVGRLTGLYCW